MALYLPACFQSLPGQEWLLRGTQQHTSRSYTLGRVVMGDCRGNTQFTQSPALYAAGLFLLWISVLQVFSFSHFSPRRPLAVSGLLMLKAILEQCSPTTGGSRLEGSAVPWVFSATLHRATYGSSATACTSEFPSVDIPRLCPKVPLYSSEFPPFSHKVPRPHTFCISFCPGFFLHRACGKSLI